MKITPIRIKGCKNIGWIPTLLGDDKNGKPIIGRQLVPLHEEKNSWFMGKRYKLQDITVKGFTIIGNK